MTTRHHIPEYSKTSNIFGVLVSALLGILAGAVTMLLLAPQSGKDTRKKIQKKSLELRDNTTDMVEKAMAQVRADRKRLTKSGRHKAQELFGQGQAMVAEQLDHVSDAALAGKKAIRNI